MRIGTPSTSLADLIGTTHEEEAQREGERERRAADSTNALPSTP